MVDINRSALPRVFSKSHERGRDRTRRNEEEDAHRFIFDYDLAKYSLDGLARVFATSTRDLERTAAAILRDEWKLPFTGRWDEDARGKRGLLRDRHSQSSRPKSESLDWYLSYHLMMTVAARLQATVPVHQDPSDSADEYSDWLRPFTLTRRDGRWLADRRDPAPDEWPPWKSESSEHWRWSVSQPDFDRVLGVHDESLNVWSSWTSLEGRREETAYVRSALVSPDRATALLRALQTADDPHDYQIPEAEGDTEVDHGAYQLRGWICTHSGSDGLDDSDPWAGRISYPPPSPAKFVRELLNLSDDEDVRVWRGTSGAEQAMTSEVWSSEPAEYDEDSEGEHGSRLRAKRETLNALLSKTGMVLIFKVLINRRIRPYRYERGSEDFRIPPYFQIIVLTSDGHLHRLNSHN